MEDSKWAVYDGKMIKANEPAVPVESRGLMYGDGCFETLRLYEGSFFKLDAHLSRLREGADFLGLKYPAELQHLSLQKQVGALLKRNKLTNQNAVLRIQVWREGGRGYHIQGDSNSHYAVLATPLPTLTSSVSLATVDVRRIPSKALPSNYKLCNNINYIHAAGQAMAKGADDALMQTIDGFLSETTIANVFWKSGDTVYTPSLDCDLLPGITRNTVIYLLEQYKDLKIESDCFKPNDIFKADTVWVCNSVREIVAISEIDGHHFDNNHSFLNDLKSDFKSYINGKLTG